jgi:hypothetical protein
VLTHEGSRSSDASTYLRDQFAPLTPLLAFGRYARAAPSCGVQWSVRSWWEEPERAGLVGAGLACQAQVQSGARSQAPSAQRHPVPRGELMPDTLTPRYPSQPAARAPPSIRLDPRRASSPLVPAPPPGPADPSHARQRGHRQECLVKLVLDPRLDEDLLVLVFEEDARFEPPEPSAGGSSASSAPAAAAASGYPSRQAAGQVPLTSWHGKDHVGGE